MHKIKDKIIEHDESSIKLKVLIYQRMPYNKARSLIKNVSVRNNNFTVKFHNVNMMFFVPSWFIDHVILYGQDQYLIYRIENNFPIQPNEPLLSPIEPRGWSYLFQKIKGFFERKK